MLADFGVKLAKETDIRVWDSTAETRFLVLPMRPAGTEEWSEERLADLVTRDLMIGTGLALTPAEIAVNSARHGRHGRLRKVEAEHNEPPFHETGGPRARDATGDGLWGRLAYRRRTLRWRSCRRGPTLRRPTIGGGRSAWRRTCSRAAW